MSQAMDELIKNAIEDLHEAIEYAGGIEAVEDEGDMIFETADGTVPIYTHNLMELASDPAVFLHENELGPAYDGSPTLHNITATAIFELLEEALWEGWNKLVAEHEDEEFEDD